MNGLWILAALAAIVGILLAAQSLARLGVPGESSPPITAARTTGVAIGSNFGGIPPVLRFAPGTATMSESKLRAFLFEQGCGDPTCLLTDKSEDIRPVEIDGYRSARGLPAAVGVVPVLLLVATLMHVLLTTMRRRAADLAVFRRPGSSRPSPDCAPRASLGGTGSVGNSNRTRNPLTIILPRACRG